MLPIVSGDDFLVMAVVLIDPVQRGRRWPWIFSEQLNEKLVSLPYCQANTPEFAEGSRNCPVLDCLNRYQWLIQTAKREWGGDIASRSMIMTSTSKHVGRLSDAVSFFFWGCSGWSTIWMAGPSRCTGNHWRDILMPSLTLPLIFGIDGQLEFWLLNLYESNISHVRVWHSLERIIQWKNEGCRVCWD